MIEDGPLRMDSAWLRCVACDGVSTVDDVCDGRVSSFVLGMLRKMPRGGPWSRMKLSMNGRSS